MASFEKSSDVQQDGNAQKYSIRRLEPSIQKFLKVLEIDLDRLHRHRLNIQKLTGQEDWKTLNKEQVNASRTVQQIKANVREIEKARNQIQDEDLEEFDCKVEDMKLKAIKSVQELVGSDASTTTDDNASECDNTGGESSIKNNYTSLPATMDQVQKQELHIVPENSQAAASWENLQENLVELNEMIHDFASMVEDQGEKVDRIEDNIEKAQSNVKEGALSLGKASKYKAAMLPVAGALIGGLLAGPLGLVAGAKIGGLAGAIGGGVFGFAGGKFIKNRQDKIVEVEMKNLSDKRSSSLPDLRGNTEDGSLLTRLLPSQKRTTSESGKDDT